MGLEGTASDDVPQIRATGGSGVGMLFVSMAARHPEGADADYLAWHSLDHRPEQYRLPTLRATLRLVSTPACRDARAASGPQFDATDHVMTYFFADPSGLAGFSDLSAALRGAGRTPFVLPPLERGVYEIAEVAADPQFKVGAEVLPWWPAAGVYLVIEEAGSSPPALLDVPGVTGTWSALASAEEAGLSTAPAGQRITYCFLDENPVAVAGRLAPVLEQRWRDTGEVGLLAAPFHVVVPREWDRYLP